MPIFEYEALNSSGKLVKGMVDAESARAARAKLRGRGIYPTQIKEESEAENLALRPSPFSLFFRKVKARDIVLAFRQLATLAEAGIPLTSALTALVEQLHDPLLKKIFTQVRERVREGNSLAEALALHPQIFPRLFIGLVRAGEASGTLPLSLARWADFSEQQVDMQERMRGAMTYPIFMLIIGLGVLFFLLTFVIPTVTKIFADLGQSLPLPTLVLISISNFFSRYWWILLLGMALLFLLSRRYMQSEAGIWFRDRWRLKVPLIGDLHRQLVISRWARTMATLLQGGLPLLSALQIAQEVVANILFRKALAQAEERVKEGGELSSALQENGLFPALVLEMVAAGEKSGYLEKMLEKIAAHLERETEIEIRRRMSLLEPMMILIMGVGVGFIALSILLPILEMSQAIR
ncbi:MAG: type II secretion system inner membrane protein GspF [Thermodesulfobacteriota bacterium]